MSRTYEVIITEVFEFLDGLSRSICRDHNTRDELRQEVIEQILIKDKKQIIDIDSEGKIIDYCAKIMLVNYNSSTSPFKYHRIKKNKSTVHYEDYEGFIELYKFSNDNVPTSDEYIEQQMVLDYVLGSDNFDSTDYGILKAYFGAAYNFKEMYLQLKEDSCIIFSYGWMHARLKSIKDRIPNEFRERWKS